MRGHINSSTSTPTILYRTMLPVFSTCARSESLPRAYMSSSSAPLAALGDQS
jgi:hypothetical protein